MKAFARMSGLLVLAAACAAGVGVALSALAQAQADLIVDRINDSRPTVTAVQPAGPDGWSYDAMSDGTMIGLPGGATLWVPRDNKLCPRLLGPEAEEGVCIEWADMGRDDVE